MFKLNPEPTLSIVPSWNGVPANPVVDRITNLPSFNCDSRTRALQAIQMLTKRDDEINREEQELLAKATVLIKRRRELNYRMFKAKAIVSPWRRIPDDVLIMIFKIVVGEDPDMIARITSACKQWRRLTLEAPSLWSSLRVTEENEKFLNKIKLFSKKSHERPLRIFYRQDPKVAREAEWKCWTALLGLSKRWQTFLVEFLNIVYATRRLRSFLTMPNLQELSIGIYAHVDTNDHARFRLDDLQQASIPNLVSLRFIDFLPPSMLEPCWVSQLTTLHIIDRFKALPASTKDPMNPLHILLILEQCSPVLVEFVFESPNSGDYWGKFTEQLPIRKQTIKFLCLERLKLFCATPVIEAILRSARLDPLIELHLETAITLTIPQKNVEFQVQRASDVVASLLSYAQRLGYLFIEGLAANVFPLGSPRTILSNVECLHVKNVEPLDAVLSLLESVRRDGSVSRPYWYAPRLRNLELSYFAHDVEHFHSSFCKIVRERWYDSRPPHAEVAQLETLTLSGENLLEDPAKGQVRMFKPRLQSARRA